MVLMFIRQHFSEINAVLLYMKGQEMTELCPKK